MEIIKLDDFPLNAKQNQIYEIIPDKSKVVSSTNRLFNKYPTRYISAIPRYAIKSFSNIGDSVIDPFCGSGTTAIEAMRLGRNAISIDVDPFARLLIEVKTTVYNEEDFRLIEVVVDNLRNSKFDGTKEYEMPNIPSIEKWFCENSRKQLAYIKEFIDKETKDNIKVHNYLYVVMAGIIRKCSNADDVSPKPYISTRFPKTPEIPLELFFKYEKMYRAAIKEFSDEVKGFDCTSTILESNDARNIKVDTEIDLAVTSPPYINAYDYVRSLKFEDIWLGLATDSELRNNRRMYIGTEQTSALYSNYQYACQSRTLMPIVEEIRKIDSKRAKIVATYFEDMAINLVEIGRNLKESGFYVIVTGDSTIRKQIIPTSKILTEIAEQNGFKFELSFQYVIRDRYLHLPRGNRGGIIKYDDVLVLRKV